MAGENDLKTLLTNMHPVLTDGVYVFCTGDRDWNDLDPIMIFEEIEGKTAILSKDIADQHGVDYSFPCRMITLNIHSGLEAVGFLAAITKHLADAGISVNAVSAFYHDHLFVPDDKAAQAIDILQNI